MIARGKANNPKFGTYHIKTKPSTVKKAAQLPSVPSRRSTKKRPVKPCPKGNDVCYCH